MDSSDKKSAMQRKILYGFLLVSLAGLYVSYVPQLLDYYVIRPQYSFLEFYNRSLLDETYAFEGVVLGLVLGGLYCATLNAGVSVLVPSVLLFVLTHAGYLKYINRRELLRLDDLKLTEVAGMAANYIRFEYSSFLLLLAGGLLAFVGAGFGAELLRRHPRTRPVQVSADSEQTPTQTGQTTETLNRSCPHWVLPVARVLGALAFCGILVGYTKQYFTSEMQWDAVEAVNPVQTDSNRHVLYQFLRNDRLISVNAEDVEASRAFLTEQGAILLNAAASGVDTASDSAVCPNVIVIMNESWWNTDWLDADKISFSKDPMEPYRQLESQCGSGYLTSNVFGGGTVSSEAEFLTGLNTKYYLGDAAVYTSTLGRKLPTVVDYFKALDYETTAIHPYYGDFYSRDQVYLKMGFDHIIFEEDMQYRELYTNYISDDSLVSEIIARYESADSERQFIWAVSIGNHGPELEYSEEPVEDYEYPISVTLQGMESGKEQRRLTNYVNGIYLAGQAYARLVEYFTDREEPVVLVMFGDHIPNFSKEIYDALDFATYEWEDIGLLEAPTKEAADFAMEQNGMRENYWKVFKEVLSTEELSPEQSRMVYSVPVLLWSNAAAEELSCKEEKPSFAGENIYYLPQMMLDYAGLPDSDMTLALRYERSLFRTNARAFVLDAEGEPVRQCTEEQVRGLRTMQIMEYDILFGEGLCRDIWTPLKGK